MEKFKHEVYEKYTKAPTVAQVREAVAQILEHDFAANNTPEIYKKCFSCIDLTSLHTTDTDADIRAMMEKVNNFGKYYPDMPTVAAVCVYPSLVSIAKAARIGQMPIAAVSACFPSSQTFIEAKIAETALTVAAGADEIDLVISVGKFLSGYHSEVSDELRELRDACRGKRLKVILESGALGSAAAVKQASLLAMVSGADFIKTSTGKQEPAATLEATYVMCSAIKEFYKKTGIRIGFKPAGGIVTTEDSVRFYTVAHAVLGDTWMNSTLFRIGASRLANNLLSSIYDKPVSYF